MNAAEITDKLALHSLRQRTWYIQATCATSGDGLYEGLDWLSGQLKNASKQKQYDYNRIDGTFIYINVLLSYSFTPMYKSIYLIDY